MGLWDVLTKDINLTGAKLRWREPVLFRVRLRGDLLSRVAVAIGAWFAAAGVMAIIFSFNVDPPSMGLAFGLGAVFGLGPACLCLFLAKGQASGSIQVFADRIQRKRTYAGFTANWLETSSWGFGLIDRCHMVPSNKLGKAFHAMFFKLDGQWELMAIPAAVNVKQLRSLMSSHGTEVVAAAKIPDQFRTPISLALPGVFAGVGIVLLAVGFFLLNGK